MPQDDPAARSEAGLREFTAALDAAHESVSPGTLVGSPAGWAVASPARAEGVEVAGSSGALVAVRDTAPATDQVLQAFADQLLTLHRKALGEVLDVAVARLDKRVSEGSNLLNRQLVRGSAADVALALSETDDLRALPDPTPARRWRVHQEMVGAGRVLLKLYGASSFASDGPGRLLYLTELLGNTYLYPRAREDGGDE